MARDVPIHYLRANHAEWTPPAVAVLDTETRTIEGERDVQALRCWAASVAARPGGSTDHDTRRDAHGTDVVDLAAWLDGTTRKLPTLWCYAHNLGFDLAVTRLPVVLGEMGWTVTDFAVDGRAPWMRLAKGRRRITLSDSWSWIPRALATIAVEVGITKPALPDDGDDEADWLARCTADVDILYAAMTQLMDWWHGTGRGRWSVTGAASGWNAFRHTPNPFKVVIDPDPEGVAHDRLAIYGGKRYVNRVGKLTPGGYVEVDFERAYTVVARDLPLPMQRMRSFDSLPIDDPRIDSPRWGIIAECEIETDKPRWPKRDNDRVWYPVGRFRTVLASPEILQAREKGCLRSIGKGYTYRLAPHMAEWARWCLACSDATCDDTPSVVRLVAKQWGRSVIGKWAQHSYARIRLGAAPTLGWGYEDAWMANTHTRGSMVDLGGNRFLCYADGDGENAFPAILAFVESHVRVRLSAAIDAVGSAAFVSCDTDGLLVGSADLIRRARLRDTFDRSRVDGTDPVAAILEKISTVTAPLNLRVKSTFSRVEVIGPQHLRLDDTRRFAGIPGKGEELPDGRIGAWTWPKLAAQMARGDPRGYVREFAVYRVPRNLASGWVVTDGRVLPVEYARDDSGRDRPLPWESTRWAAGGYTLAASQNLDVLALAGRDRGGG
jgi:hypothetical protein